MTVTVTRRRAGEIRTCKQPDRDVPQLTCGYPLPCPHHTLVIENGKVRVPPRGSVPGALRARAIAKALKR